MDIFRDGQKIKKIFNPKRNSKHSEENSQISNRIPGQTLDRIVNAKEEARRQWEETQDEFARRKREHEITMIDMEQAEIVRREKEIREEQENIDEQRRKNRLIQDQFAAQIKSLQEKLEEYKLNHKATEDLLEDEISKKEDKLAEVKTSLETRIRLLEQDNPNNPSAPFEIYPTLMSTRPLTDVNTSHLSLSSRSVTPSDCSV